jgi:glycine hydroxymethyltransferase
MAGGMRLVSGGTDSPDAGGPGAGGITGKESERLLDEVGITVNKNTLPFDNRPPMVTSGIRIGVPAVTTRGMAEDAMERIARIITRVLKNPAGAATKAQAAREVQVLDRTYPLYPGLW